MTEFGPCVVSWGALIGQYEYRSWLVCARVYGELGKDRIRVEIRVWDEFVELVGCDYVGWIVCSSGSGPFVLVVCV